MDDFVFHAVNQECGFKLVQHLRYSPDLSRSATCLFPKMKKELSVGPFDSDDQIVLEVRDTDFFKEGICLLLDCRAKSVTLVGSSSWCGSLVSL